ncbi:DUF305 domain-containing protein [[Mycobacterium] nativiensis]|uniref:DUF305 domain-containing protein n=1 Tax=[Mycobacterium] nativiensis TaxID=2855503 RepID=A0ABU5XYI0_9MYCO|nr:DUF305 domain-containing protein [Mycolicibacter sp. MYC340]MEB3032980.1 DUF305 domain-containing protein [Mycolicibacter sp. MYC340]
MRTAITVAVAVVVSIAAGACHSPAPGGPSAAPETQRSSGAPGAATGSAGDIAFLENMVVHHQQALELTALSYGRSTNSALLALANQITAQQQTELQGCQAQLLQWEAPGSPSAQNHAEIPGMVDQATIDKLRNLHGAAFDKLWLQTMIAHHRGAITMAHNEIEQGQSPEAISIAQSLLPRQQADIDQMTAMLGET